jgi:hypothetical protein
VSVSSKKTLVAVACVFCLGVTTGSALAQERPDAKYPNPSGQDSNPGKTTVKPTQTAPPSESNGKKADQAAGCSTPTTAADAGASAPKKKTVCTTSGDKAAAPKKPDQR